MMISNPGMDTISKRKRKLRVAMTLAVLGVLGLLVWSSIHITRREPKEPEYEGKPLSYWTEKLRYDDRFVDGVTLQKTPAFHEDVKAIRTIGSNAIPYLLVGLSARDSEVRRIATRVTDSHGSRMRVKSADAEREEAICAFKVLGERGAIAVPSLIEMLRNSDVKRVSAVIRALIGIGRSAHPSVRYATNFIFHPVLSSETMELISTVGPAAKEALPALQAALQSTNVSWRLNALAALGQFGTNAAPLLRDALGCLDDRDPGVAGNALNVVNAAQVTSPQVKEALLRAMPGANAGHRRYIHMTLTNLFPDSIESQDQWVRSNRPTE